MNYKSSFKQTEIIEKMMLVTNGRNSEMRVSGKRL